MTKQLYALVIDDDHSLGQGFVVALQRCGFRAEQITDSREALTEIERRLPDVITLDVHMANVSGIEILRGVRDNPKIAHIKVIMVTASSTITQDETVNDLADVILMKPVSLAQIVAFATRLIEEQSGDLAALASGMRRDMRGVGGPQEQERPIVPSQHALFQQDPDF